MKLVAALLLLAAFASPLASAGDRPPSQVVEALYRWRIHPNAQDVEPNRVDDDYRISQALFSRPLAKALATQKKYQDACARLTPGIKPWMIDQDIFFLGPDGAKALDSTTTKVIGKFASVSAHLSYDKSKWTDTVLLENVDGRWVVVDIQWQEGSSLTERLVAFANHLCKA